MIREVSIITLPIEFLQLRVLLWKVFEERDFYMGQCLETGSVATADDVDTLKDMMRELIIDEVEYNLNNIGSLKNLFSAPALRHVWQRYYTLSLNRNADLVGGIRMLDDTF